MTSRWLYPSIAKDTTPAQRVRALLRRQPSPEVVLVLATWGRLFICEVNPPVPKV